MSLLALHLFELLLVDFVLVHRGASDEIKLLVQPLSDSLFFQGGQRNFVERSNRILKGLFASIYRRNGKVIAQFYDELVLEVPVMTVETRNYSENLSEVAESEVTSQSVLELLLDNSELALLATTSQEVETVIQSGLHLAQKQFLLRESGSLGTLPLLFLFFFQLSLQFRFLCNQLLFLSNFLFESSLLLQTSPLVLDFLLESLFFMLTF